MLLRAAMPLLLLLGACDDGPASTGGDDTTDETQPPDPDGDDTDVVETDTTPDAIEPSVSGTTGNIIVLHNSQGMRDPARTRLRGLFLQDTAPALSPAACVVHDQYCYTALPTNPGEYVDIVKADYTTVAPSFIDVGESITLGTNELLRLARPAGTSWWYGYDSEIYPGLGPLTATIGGQWGLLSDVVIDVPAALTTSAPDPRTGITLDPGTDVEFSWTPGTDGDLYLVVDLPPVAARIWKLDDDGAHTLIASELGDLTQQAVGTIELFRYKEARTTWGDNTLITQVISRQKWNASTVARSCLSVLRSNPAAASGVYTLQPDPALPAQPVFCDMTTDGGGWTLVSSSNRTVDDQASNYDANLATLSPNGAMRGVWSGMRAVTQGNRTDIRFTCSNGGGGMAVDLSFYSTIWYNELTSAGNDAAVCFNENNGAGADPPPARRDNRSGRSLPAGDAWGAGYLEGEDACDSPDDFTVDFDDRGMDNNQGDGTDWGEDDTTEKCAAQQGNPLQGSSWFIFVREP